MKKIQLLSENLQAADYIQNLKVIGENIRFDYAGEVIVRGAIETWVNFVVNVKMIENNALGDLLKYKFAAGSERLNDLVKRLVAEFCEN